MITDKKTLQEYLAYEKTFYLSEKIFHVFRQWIMRSPNYLIWHYQKILRVCEYHYNVGHRIRYAYFRRRKNIEGARLGIYINHNSFEKGLHIYHYGSIIVHENARIGQNCSLHGENCIGNKGIGAPTQAPVIGDFCDIGIGAKILGEISLGDHVTIGANAVVTKSFPQNHICVAGVPAHILSASPED